MMRAVLLLLLLGAASGQTGSIQVTPNTATLWAQSSYLVSYYTFYNMPNSSTFTLNFTATFITVPAGALNASAVVNGAAVAGVTGSCSGAVCTLRLNKNVLANTNIRFTIGSFTNPYFLRAQPITANVTFNASYSEAPAWTIPADQYTPMPITAHSLTQSDYGVGNTDVSYLFNFSLPMSPAAVQLSLTIPPQVAVGSLQTSLVYYGAVQYAVPVFVNNIVVLTFNATPANASDPNGFILLNVSGLTNPQSMGNSSSFVLQILLPTLPGTASSCSNCFVAVLGSALLAQSKVPGNIQTLNMFSSNALIGQQNNVTIYSKLYASIPAGGIFQILLPAAVRPVLPVSCASTYGFEMLNAAAPSCSYNASTNAVFTNNFVFSGTGSVVITLAIFNPPDTARASFYFQSFDAAGNMIGNSTAPYSIAAAPLPLSASALKTNYQVESAYRLTVNCTLAVALASSNTIQVVLPQAGYNASAVTCSVGAAVPCSASVDPASLNLTVTLAPPCSPCAAGTAFSFAVDGLTNPSFINSYSQAVIVQSATASGVIETASLALALSPSALTVGNYTRSGGSAVGSAYAMSFTYTASSYISLNGGMLLINFSPLDTFVNPLLSADGSYEYPPALSVTDGQNNQYSNSATYSSSSSPSWLQQIAVSICGGSSCAGSITISGLRKGFSPLAALTQNIQITTVFGDSVSTSTFNAMQFNAARASRPLGLALSNSVTSLRSKYELDFVSPSLPFQSGLTFALSALHTIHGGCFLTHNASLFNGVFSCQVLNSTAVALNYSGDPALMMLETIGYRLSIIDVANPVSVVPLTYQLTTQFSGTPNAQFTATYAIQTPLPLDFLAAKSNNTFGQPAALNITVVSNYPAFNEIKIAAASALITVLPSSGPTAYQSAMVNNAYQISQIYALANQSVVLSIVNPNSTAASGSISFSMFNAGYLSATGAISLQSVAPMFLGLSAATSSRTVGEACNLTVTFQRVNSYSSESQFMLNLTSALYDVSAAQLNGAPAAFPLAVPIGLTTITLTNLRNLLFVPLATPANAISAWTLDAAGAAVAVTSYSPAGLAPNTPATALGMAATRSNTVISGVGSLTISYTPRFPAAASVMTVSLPASQSALVSPACTMQGGSNGAGSCAVVSSNSSSITVGYFNQTSITLGNVVNVEPNSNQLKVTLLTASNELVETGTGSISPSIQYNQLSLSGSVSSATVASPSQVRLTFSSPSTIDAGSRIVVNMPSAAFTKLPALASQDCTYSVAGMNYSGCQYSYMGAWLAQVNFTASAQLAASTPVLLTIYTTNAWSVLPFGAQGLTVLVSNPADNFVAQGSISLATLYGGIPNLIAAAVGNATLTQASTVSNSNNSVTISFSLGVSLSTGSTLTLWLPKSAYFLSASNALLVSGLQSQAENSTYYVLTVLLPCSQAAPLCSLPGAHYSLTVPLQNNPYSQKQNSPVVFQLQLMDSQVTAQSSLPLLPFTPQALSPASASISRSDLNAFASTNVTIVVPNPTTVSTFTVVVSPLAKGTATLPLVSAPSYAGVGSSLSFPFQLNSSNFLTVTVSMASGASSSIIVSGKNSLLVSPSEAYTVTLLDANFVYFTGQVTPSDTLLPYSSGLGLERSVTTVGTSTNVYLFGTLPASIPALSVSFNGNDFTVSGSTFNVSLGTMVNNNNVSDASTYPISIKNSDFTAFSSRLPISPALTAQTLTALIGVSMPPVVNVSSSFNITVSLTSTSLTYLTIKTGQYFKTLTKCCIDAACTQTLIKSCTLAQEGNNFIELWLSSAQVLSSVVFQVIALDYQASFKSQTMIVSSALPSSSIAVISDLTIAAVSISTSLALLNWKVSSTNTYTLSIQPIAKVGYLQISLPSFISAQFTSGSSNCSYTLTINGSVSTAAMLHQNGASTLAFPLTPSTSNVALLLTSIVNPPDNTPYSITVTQASDQNLLSVYGYSKIGLAMTEFDQITLSSAVRVVTKVNVATSLILEATTPYDSSQFVITFPASQLLTTQACSVTVNEHQVLPCQVINSSSVLTSSFAGANRYAISGLMNQKYYNANSTMDRISAQIGTTYTKATTVPSSSVFVSPHLTLGSIVVNSMLSSSSVMLASTTLTYNISIENTNNINGFLLSFSSYHYIFSPSLSCSINSAKIACAAIDNSTIFMPYPSPSTNALIVSIHDIVNFIQPSAWTFKSVQNYPTSSTTAYSDVDLYYNDGSALAPLEASAMAVRVILPYNHVQSSPVTFQAIIDSQYGSFLPLASFSLNFTTQSTSCQQLSSAFAATLSITCSFPQSARYSMKLQLYHAKFPSVALSVGSSSLFIYPAPGGGCSNQMCDSCSSAEGQEYCFSCREGLYSSNGQCSRSCSAGSFPYSSNICQQCSPTCSSCFGLYSAECLSCSSPALTLSSGTCVEDCPLPSYAYSGFCVGSEECTSAPGCRLCSTTGFCYQCLPDYAGAPSCKYVNVMPPTIMVYFLAPLAALALLSVVVAAAKCVGADSLLSQTIFSFSSVELFAWAFTVPVMPSVMAAMALVAFFTLRVIISIVSYETFYKKNMGELSQKLLEEESQKEETASEQKGEAESHLHNWKTKLVRLTAHFNGPDSYELLKCRIADPVLAVSSSLAVDALFMANRWVVCFLMFYMASVGSVGDSVLMPIFVIANAALLSLCRLLAWDKFRKCISSCRS